MHPMPKAPPVLAADATPPTFNVACRAAVARQPAGASPVGELRHSNSVIERAGAVVMAISAGRSVPDGEIRQHAMDCGWLMEQAYARFEDHGDPADRDEAVLWMHRRGEALDSLSPAWKAARDAEIQRAIGVDYFFDQADATRRRVAGA